MFEAVKVVSPSSSHSLALQLSTENNKDFSHFSQPHAVEKKKNERIIIISKSLARLYRSIRRQSLQLRNYCTFCSTFFSSRKKGRKLDNLFENDNF